MTHEHTGAPTDLSYAHSRCELAGPGLMRARIAGELDACSVPAVGRELQATLGAHRGSLVLDLSDLQYIDSTGIRLLVYWLGQIHQSGHEVVIVTPREVCARRALETVGLTQMVRAVASFEEVACYFPGH